MIVMCALAPAQLNNNIMILSLCASIHRAHYELLHNMQFIPPIYIVGMQLDGFIINVSYLQGNTTTHSH